MSEACEGSTMPSERSVAAKLCGIAVPEGFAYREEPGACVRVFGADVRERCGRQIARQVVRAAEHLHQRRPHALHRRTIQLKEMGHEGGWAPFLSLSMCGSQETNTQH